MNKIKLLLPLCSFLGLPFFPLTVEAAYTTCSCTSLTHDRTKSHLELSLSTVPDLKFYERTDMKGGPAIRLNDKGAYMGNTLLCSWPRGSFLSEKEPNRVLGFDGKRVSNPCPSGFPVESAFGDLGVGTAVLCLEITRQTGDIFEVSYKGKSYYLDPKTLNKMKWKKEAGNNQPCERPK